MSRPGPGALGRMPGGYMLFGIGATVDESTELAVRARLDAMLATMRSFAAGLYLNVTEQVIDINFAEHVIDIARLFDADILRRLEAARAVGPHGVFRANHPSRWTREPAGARDARPHSWRPTVPASLPGGVRRMAGDVGSSTMAQNRNAKHCVRVAMIGAQVRALVRSPWRNDPFP